MVIGNPCERIYNLHVVIEIVKSLPKFLLHEQENIIIRKILLGFTRVLSLIYELLRSGGTVLAQLFKLVIYLKFFCYGT
jgi:hypothetical protein